LISGDRQSARKRRNRYPIIAQILVIARHGVSKTQIMYGANLSFAELKAYLPFLIKLKLIETTKKDEKVIYKTTPRGARYIERYEEIRRLLSKSGEDSKGA